MLVSTYHCIVPMHMEEELDFPDMVGEFHHSKFPESLEQACSYAIVRAWCACSIDW